jgi:hypothetical protein
MCTNADVRVLGTLDNAPIDDDDARLYVARTVAWPRLGLDLSAMPGDEVQKQVAER